MPVKSYGGTDNDVRVQLSRDTSCMTCMLGAVISSSNVFEDKEDDSDKLIRY